MKYYTITANEHMITGEVLGENECSKLVPIITQDMINSNQYVILESENDIFMCSSNVSNLDIDFMDLSEKLDLIINRCVGPVYLMYNHYKTTDMDLEEYIKFYGINFKVDSDQFYQLTIYIDNIMHVDNYYGSSLSDVLEQAFSRLRL